MVTLSHLKSEIRTLSNKEKGVFLQRFFKSGKGGYAEGDVFVGLVVPQSRVLAKKYGGLSEKDIKILLGSKIHEERLIALFILVNQFAKADDVGKKKIYELYLSQRKYVNNWDLVDSSADKIVGAYLFKKPRGILYDLASSDNVWDRRIAIIATFYFIKNGVFDETFKIAEIVLKDKHDLIHKAAGWMLREIGNRDLSAEESFLKKHYKTMPRTMLRYAIEKFPEEKRKKYLYKR